MNWRVFLSAQNKRRSALNGVHRIGAYIHSSGQIDIPSGRSSIYRHDELVYRRHGTCISSGRHTSIFSSHGSFSPP